MAKKAVAKKVTVKVLRAFMLGGKIVEKTVTLEPKKKGEEGEVVDAIVSLPEDFARELIANGKAKLSEEKPNIQGPKEEQTFEEEFADL